MSWWRRSRVQIAAIRVPNAGKPPTQAHVDIAQLIAVSVDGARVTSDGRRWVPLPA